MHLLVAITSHGYGHAAQVAPVLNRLAQLCPGLRLTLLTSLPRQFLDSRLQVAYTRIDAAPDFGLLMGSALDIDHAASAAAYAALHGDWAGALGRETGRLERLAPDLVLADVPYLTLAGAAHAGIPAIALCSLNWADIYRHYYSARPEAAAILAQMENAYRSARAFLCPEPSMPMDFLDNRRSIGPISVRAGVRRDALREQLGLASGERLVVIAPGGVPARFPVERWPRDQGVHWLVADDWEVDHPDVSTLQQPGFTMPELIAAADGLLGKCGYGTVAECVVNATPLLYVPRPHWPEERYLLAWLEAHDAAVEVEAGRLDSGDFTDVLAKLDTLSVKPAEADGAGQAARYIADVLADLAAATQRAI